jgi:LPXTG-site transpeptidase (sortase) family protein
MAEPSQPDEPMHPAESSASDESPKPRRAGVTSVAAWIRGLRIAAVLTGLAAAITGTVFAISFMNTPAVLLEQPPISDYAATHTATGSLPAVRTGLWIEIPALKIALPIREGDGSNNIPDWVALHYPGTAQPGTPGNSYLYAHGLWGMFGGLLEAKEGEAVLLHDYTRQTIEVMHISYVVGHVAYNDMAWIHNTTPQTQLTLQTCIGAEWNTDRWIVLVGP